MSTSDFHTKHGNILEVKANTLDVRNTKDFLSIDIFKNADDELFD